MSVEINSSNELMKYLEESEKKIDSLIISINKQLDTYDRHINTLKRNLENVEKKVKEYKDKYDKKDRNKNNESE